MKRHLVLCIAASALACAMAAPVGAGAGIAFAQGRDIDEVIGPDGVPQPFELTAAQRSAIYQAVSREKGKAAPKSFPAAVGADVPPMIELYALPDAILAANPAARNFKYTVVRDQVVLVDPTRMRVVATIGPKRSD